MTTKELSRQWRMLDTAYDRILKQVRELNMEKEAEDQITEILDSQKILHRQEIAGGKFKFQVDDVADAPIAKVAGIGK